MESIRRLSRCCFTGHRPEKLGVPESEVKEKLRRAIRRAIKDGFNVFISGMARGVDIWAAEIVLEEREENTDIKLICASPFKGFERNWELSDRIKYNEILKEADFVKFVCPSYSRSCFQIRNQYMVDRSNRVIAVYNRGLGGTKNTINYAGINNVEVVNILGEC